MKSFGLIAVLAAVLMAAPVVYAQTAAPAAGITVHCNDGTSMTVKSMRGACRGHKGVNKSETHAQASPEPSAKSAAAHKPESSASPAVGGGAGQVWVNTGSKTKVYHCQGSKWYGKTKQGKYMSVSEAQAAGYHAAKNEKCE